MNEKEKQQVGKHKISTPISAINIRDIEFANVVGSNTYTPTVNISLPAFIFETLTSQESPCHSLDL